MSDAPTPTSDPASQLTPSEPPPVWQPPPREWTWRDLFTAPMLAFKPKCMVAAALTMLLIGAWLTLLYEPLGDGQALEQNLRTGGLGAWFHHVVVWLWWAVALALAGLGSTFVATFIKADLLDDEFLTWGEAWRLFQARLLPAVLVPVFLLTLATGFWLVLYGGSLAASIPYVGATLYALLYPLVFLFGLLVVLVAVAGVLGLFLAPGIIASRRHGWFDNVVDTIEAVGTKPHLLIAGLLLSLTLAGVVRWVGGTAQETLTDISRELPKSATNQITATEDVAGIRRLMWTRMMEPGQWSAYLFHNDVGITFSQRMHYENVEHEDGWIKWGPGLITAFWQSAIAALILGFAANVMVAGGLLTYLWLREDDYWDEEDLQDLDQLAAELEAEAKAEAQAQATAEAKTEATAPASIPPAAST